MQYTVPVAVRLLDYIHRQDYTPDIVKAIFNSLTFLILESQYSIKVIMGDEEKTYQYPKSLIVYAQEHKDAYAFKIVNDFKTHIDKKRKMILFDEKGNKVRSFN